MNEKERVLAVLERQPVDRLPVDLWHTPEIAAELRDKIIEIEIDETLQKDVQQNQS